MLRRLIATKVNRGNRHCWLSNRRKTPARGGNVAAQVVLRTRNGAQQRRLSQLRIAASERHERFFKSFNLFEIVAVSEPATYRTRLNAHYLGDFANRRLLATSP